jgi:hypothetical protein
MMHGTATELFVHESSDTTRLQGARRAAFPLLPPWLTGLFGTATAVCSEQLHPEQKNIGQKSRAKRLAR